MKPLSLGKASTRQGDPLVRLAWAAPLAILACCCLQWAGPQPAHAQRSLDLHRERAQTMLRVVSKRIEEDFVDPKLRGLDWQGLTAQVRQQVDLAQSPSEMFLAIFRLANQLQDSHTIFVPPARAVRYAFGFEAKAFGDEVRVFELSSDGSAAAGGLRLGDRLLSINGFTVDRDSYAQMMLFFRLVHPVSAMEIVFSRDGESSETVVIEGRERREALVSDLTRIDTLYQLLRDAESAREEYHYQTFDGGVGYLYLPSFRGDTEFLQNLVKKIRGARSVIVDLRGNPGGSIESLKTVAGFFEDERLDVATLVGRNGTKPLTVKPQKPRLSGRVTVLVDSASASASEIFAYHLQRTSRAIVVGDRTAGRVTAAQLHQFGVGADRVVPYLLQVTTHRVVFPDGSDLEGVGVEPDQPCLPSVEDLTQEGDPCLRLALSLARGVAADSE